MKRVSLPYFNNIGVEVDEETDLSIPEAAAALNAFISLSPNDRSADAPHIYAYYKDIHLAVGGEEWMDAEMGVPKAPSDIWKSVSPTHLMVIPELVDDGHWYVGVTADCAWEKEHGLWMVWKDGRQICKVGEYDGHASNASAHGDESVRNVVYKALDDEFTTYFEARE
ncbi:DUF6985 domain-containing protein [Tianweitania populi]|uniref:DUF6985 domain-containing protein n=1 Tax=Tianweitania populi TaxID=1607949 RepID=A0A8J3DZC4_9HYPH|nr:hypothetical protein [Tianweitania populi]GHD23605.1 hypothetical protein GCM10016234_38950 [Tianweitania populi]